MPSTPPPGLPARFQEVTAIGPDAWTARESDGGRRVRILRIPASAGEGATGAPAARIRVRIPHAPEILAFGPLQDGSVWTAERDYEGLSLADLRARTEDVGEGMRSLWLDAVQHAAEAVVAAHRAGIIHGALSPDRLLLDERDYATIIGWEHARLIGSTETASADGPWQPPEQGPGATADPRWDIHALGAILHLVLFGKPPLRRAGARGSLDIPDSSTRIRVADDLATLAFMAVQADPADRTGSAEAFLDQLIRARSNPIAITTEVPAAAPPRRRGLTTLAVLATLIVGWWTLGQVSWPPAETVVLSEDFADDAWTGRWRGIRGGFQRDQGALVSNGRTDSVLILNRRIHPPVSISCTAMIRPGAPVGDLTFLWCETDPFVSDTIYRTNAYLAQTGAYDNTFAGISGSAGRLQLARRDFILESGRSYRLSLQIEDDRMRLIVDGEVIADHVSQVPFGAGWIGLLAYYPGKVFDDIIITQKKPGRGDALAIGDALLTRGHHEEAAEEYASVAQRSEDPALADIARYRQGVALAAAGRHAEAVTTWGQIATEPWKDLGTIYSQRRWIAIGDHATVAAGLRRSGRWEDSRLRDAGRAVWGEALRALGSLPERSGIEAALAVRESCLAPDPASAWAAAEAAWKVGLYQEALDLGAGDRRAVAWSLLALGRAEEVLARFPEQVQASARACLMLDRFDEIFRSYPQVVWAVREAGLATGRVDGAAAQLLHEDSGELHRLRLILGGAPAEAGDAALPPQHRLVAALLMDDLATVADLSQDRPCLEADMLREGASIGLERSRSTGPTRAMAVICRLLEEPGEDEARALWNEIDGWGANATFSDLWFARAVVLPWLRLGSDVPPSDLIGRLPALPGTRAGRLHDFLRRRIDTDAYLDQPAALEAKGYLPLALAIRAEIEGDRNAALASYRAYLATPPWQRPQHGSWDRELISEWFARWRLRSLGDQPPG